MIEVVGTLRSRAFRVLWALEELGLDYSLRNAMPRTDEVRALNPTGKVPVLIEGDTVLTDSVAIITYLADREGKLTFPAGTVERAQQDARLNAVLDEMEAAIWAGAKHSFGLPEDKRVPEVKDSLKYEFALGVDWFTGRLGDGPYVMGETFTTADIVVTHLGNWAARTKYAYDNPAFDAYLDRVRERPAYQKVDGLDK